VGITAGSREVPGRNGCDRRHTYCIIIIKLVIMGVTGNISKSFGQYVNNIQGKYEKRNYKQPYSALHMHSGKY